MGNLRIIALLVVLAGRASSGANIVFFFSAGTYSHKESIWPLASALADRGHNVTFFSSHDRQPWSHQNITEIIPYKLKNLLSDFLTDKIGMRLAGKERTVWETLSKWSLDICRTIITDQDPAVKSLLWDTHVDLVFINAALGECGYIISEKWNAKIILSDSTSVLPYFHDMLGLVVEDSWVPDISSLFVYPMNFFHRVQNFMYSVLSTYDRRTNLYPELEIIMKEYLNVAYVPPFYELERERTSLVMLNTGYWMDFARALPPNFVPVGGLQLWDSRVQPIPKDIEVFMDGAEDGVVLLALGTAVDVSKSTRLLLNKFLEMVEAFPRLGFIFTWGNNTIPDHVPKNLMLSKWIPQREILGHPKTRIFISHCGLNSLAEATFHGVPIVGLPLWADEDYVAYRIQMEELGLRLEMRTLTTDQLIGAVREVLTNRKYRDNMRRMSRISKEIPMSPIDVGLWWTEFALRHEDFRALRPKVEHMSWIELRNLDVHAILFLILFVFSIALAKVIQTAIKVAVNKVAPVGTIARSKLMCSK